MARSRNPLDRVFDVIVPRAVDAVDPDELLDRMDVDAVIQRVDVDGIIQRVDVDGIIQRVDVDGIIQRVDVDGIIQRVDLDALMARMDVAALLERVDLDTLLERVDLDVLLTRVDLNAVLANVDVRALASRAGIDQIVAETTTGLATRVLNRARRQVQSIDAVLLRIVDRVLRRPAPTEPVTPSFAGPLGRILAYLVDVLVVSTLFSLMVTLGGFLLELFTNRTFDATDRGSGLIWTIAYLGWWFVYLWLGMAIAGRTVGKGVVGLRVTTLVGGALGGRAATVRVLVFPFSFVLGLGFIPAVVGRQRRALHDLAAGTVEIVDWG